MTAPLPDSSGRHAPTNVHGPAAPGLADEVLQLVIVRHDDHVEAWIDAAVDVAARADGYVGTRTLRSADGGWVVVGLRWRDVEAMADAAVASAPLRGAIDDRRREPMVFFLDPDGDLVDVPVATSYELAPGWTA